MCFLYDYNLGKLTKFAFVMSTTKVLTDNVWPFAFSCQKNHQQRHQTDCENVKIKGDNHF